MKIVIFNWRDIRNPKSGGAEIVTHEHAKGWAKAGHKVILICPAYPGCRREETIDGVRIKRLGFSSSWNFLFIQILAFVYYQKRLKGIVDLVVDEIHGIPFFTPFYVEEKKLAFICEVAGEIWDRMFPKPIAIIGKFIEKNYFKIYNKVPFLTISGSTKIDLIKNGIDIRNITTIYPGNKGIFLNKIPTKNKKTTFIYLNRINNMKNLKDTLLAFHWISKIIPDAQLWVVGYSDDKKYLHECQEYIHDSKLTNSVKIFGYVDTEKKNKLLALSHVLIHTSIKEGWGLNVIEACSFGTPTVGYNIHGLRDTINHGKTGLLCERNNPYHIAKLAINLIGDKEKYKKMQYECLLWAKLFLWERHMKRSLKLISTL